MRAAPAPSNNIHYADRRTHYGRNLILAFLSFTTFAGIGYFLLQFFMQQQSPQNTETPWLSISNSFNDTATEIPPLPFQCGEILEPPHLAQASARNARLAATINTNTDKQSLFNENTTQAVRALCRQSNATRSEVQNNAKIVALQEATFATIASALMQQMSDTNNLGEGGYVAELCAYTLVVLATAAFLLFTLHQTGVLHFFDKKWHNTKSTAQWMTLEAVARAENDVINLDRTHYEDENNIVKRKGGLSEQKIIKAMNNPYRGHALRSSHGFLAHFKFLIRQLGDNFTSKAHALAYFTRAYSLAFENSSMRMARSESDEYLHLLQTTFMDPLEEMPSEKAAKHAAYMIKTLYADHHFLGKRGKKLSQATPMLHHNAILWPTLLARLFAQNTPKLNTPGYRFSVLKQLNPQCAHFVIAKLAQHRNTKNLALNILFSDTATRSRPIRRRILCCFCTTRGPTPINATANLLLGMLNSNNTGAGPAAPTATLTTLLFEPLNRGFASSLSTNRETLLIELLKLTNKEQFDNLCLAIPGLTPGGAAAGGAGAAAGGAGAAAGGAAAGGAAIAPSSQQRIAQYETQGPDIAKALSIAHVRTLCAAKTPNTATIAQFILAYTTAHPTLNCRAVAAQFSPVLAALSNNNLAEVVTHIFAVRGNTNAPLLGRAFIKALMFKSYDHTSTNHTYISDISRIYTLIMAYQHDSQPLANQSDDHFMRHINELLSEPTDRLNLFKKLNAHAHTVASDRLHGKLQTYFRTHPEQHYRALAEARVVHTNSGRRTRRSAEGSQAELSVVGSRSPSLGSGSDSD